MRRASAVALVVLLLAGCSNPPTHGYVEHKQHSDAYDYMTTVCVAYGKYGCTTYVPVMNHMPASWQLCLRADSDDKDHDSAGCIEVPEPTWSKYSEGDHYPEPR